jgi:hypothetical protein
MLCRAHIPVLARKAVCCLFVHCTAHQCWMDLAEASEYGNSAWWVQVVFVCRPAGHHLADVPGYRWYSLLLQRHGLPPLAGAMRVAAAGSRLAGDQFHCCSSLSATVGYLWGLGCWCGQTGSHMVWHGHKHDT